MSQDMEMGLKGNTMGRGNILIQNLKLCLETVHGRLNSITMPTIIIIKV